MVSNLIKRLLVIFLLLGGADLMAANPAKYNQGQYTIGEYAMGGVIFWLTPDLQHGLVASIVDMASGVALSWSPTNNTIGATGNDLSFGAGYITTGKINSELIVAHYGPYSLSNQYAASACTAYSVSVGGVTYQDWYLPSLTELGLMQSMQSTITSVSVAQGGSALQAFGYWSSFESDTNDAWFQDFLTATQNGGTSKINLHLVRAVRAF